MKTWTQVLKECLPEIVWVLFLLFLCWLFFVQPARAQDPRSENPFASNSCPQGLFEPTGAYTDWWRDNCCVWYREGSHQFVGGACGGSHGHGQPGLVCDLRPNWPGTTIHHLQHFGSAPDQEVVGHLWLPPAEGDWIADREIFIDGILVQTFRWTQSVQVACEQPPLFSDGFETGDTRRWSRVVPDPGIFIFRDGFESSDTARWSRRTP